MCTYAMLCCVRHRSHIAYKYIYIHFVIVIECARCHCSLRLLHSGHRCINAGRPVYYPRRSALRHHADSLFPIRSAFSNNFFFVVCLRRALLCIARHLSLAGHFSHPFRSLSFYLHPSLSLSLYLALCFSGILNRKCQ